MVLFHILREKLLEESEGKHYAGGETRKEKASNKFFLFYQDVLTSPCIAPNPFSCFDTDDLYHQKLKLS